MRDARAGVTHTDARRDTDVDVAPHARAGVARERASRPGARDTPRPSSRCAVARPVSRRSHPRALRGVAGNLESRRLTAPSPPRPSGGARAPGPPASSALTPRPRHFFGGGASSGAVPSDPAAQARHLRDLNRASPETVVELYEAGKVAATEANLAEYLKALVRVDRLNASALLRTLQRGAGAETNASSAGAAPGSRASILGAGAATSDGAVLGTASSPIYTQQLEPTFKAQAWRTIRTLGTAFVVLSGIGALADDRGGVTRSIMGGGEKPRPTPETKTKFDDVKGVDEAKGELVEIVEYLRDPAKFTRLGGKLPKGLLLVGPPGTGRRCSRAPSRAKPGALLLHLRLGVRGDVRRCRRATRPGSVQGGQGGGAVHRVHRRDRRRGLGEKSEGSAKHPHDPQPAPHRARRVRKNEGVIVLAATNTPETLDKALVRPGRFDRTVAVPNPDVDGRRQILAAHARGVKIAAGVDWEVIARGTPGFSGADLANLVNVAALKAALDGAKSVGMSQLEHAKDRILMGAERKSAVVAEENRRLTAYHEGGHALVALLTEGARPVHKATIVPRGQALGMVMQLPEKDELNLTRKQLLAIST